jgi:hypothetical protein
MFSPPLGLIGNQRVIKMSVVSINTSFQTINGSLHSRYTNLIHSIAKLIRKVSSCFMHAQYLDIHV